MSRPCRELHVAVEGRDHNDGSASRPYRTIARAAAEANAGDTVTIHAGVYREWVDPPRGGQSDIQRIVYRAAPGEHVAIKGSDPVTDWTHVEGDVWKTILEDTRFGDYNPYRERLGGDWFIDEGRIHHAGEIYLDGQALVEVDSLAQVMHPTPWPRAIEPRRALRAWHCLEAQGHVVIHANFGGADPRQRLVEASTRPACFYPRRTGIHYITVRGFEMCHAATPWAPPTAQQIGLVGPHWAKGWIIEDNVVHDARCCGISLGKEYATGQNRWTRERVKHGTQRERETVFAALSAGWSRDNVGSHIVRNNTIYDCEQAGICGHLGAIFSTIAHNHIHRIHAMDRFSGHEIAGIKIHAPIDVLIAHNHVHHSCRGIWMDWQTQGTRITGNLLHDNRWDDLFVEVSHGPYVVDHNILLSQVAIKNCSQGGAFAHNLVGGRVVVQPVPNRFTFYHYPHSTRVAGLMTILAGDDRYHNNIFVRQSSPDSGDPGSHAADENADLPALAPRQTQGGETGTIAYEGFPLASDDWCRGQGVDDYARMKLPVDIRANVYCNGARPYSREQGAVVRDDLDMRLRLEIRGRETWLEFEMDPFPWNPACALVTTRTLGQAFQAETGFEEPDGRALVLDVDYFGRPRNTRIDPGPFQDLRPGPQSLCVWPVPGGREQFPAAS